MHLAHTVLLLATWWLYWSCGYISHRGKVKGIGRIIRNMLILRLGKTLDIWHPEPEYEGHTKPELSQAHRDELDVFTRKD